MVGAVTGHLFRSIHSTPPVAWLTTLVVHSDSQRAGVGRQLVRAIEEWAQSRGAIRISVRVAQFPSWVRDYVIVHELAHLRHPGHTPSFWALVNRYPRAERARGYLIAKSGDEEAE